MTAEVSDVQPADLGFGVGMAVVVIGLCAIVVARADFGRRADAPAIDPGIAIPIAVRPVGDIALPSGGGPAPAVPTAWQRESEAPVPNTAAPDPVPVDPSRPRPPVHRKPVPMPEPMPEPMPTEEPAPTEPVAEGEPSPDATPSAEVGSEGVAEAGTGQGDSTTPGEGEGGDGGAGGSDPLFDRAVAFYRARLIAWFSSRFRVTGSGLPSEELARYRVSAVIEVADDLTIESYRIVSADHPLFERAADTMLHGLLGHPLPPPPENYPGAVQRRLSVTFTCGEDTCD